MILRELAAKYDLKFDDRSFKRADQTIGDTLGKLKQLGAVLGAALAVKAIWGMVDGLRSLGDELDKTSLSLGISTQALQEWQFAAGIGGVSTQELNVSLRTLQRAAAEAGDGVATYKDEFDRLGISVKDTNGNLKSADQLLTEMADGLQRLPTETQKVATAQILMGRSGSKMLPVFAAGSEGIAKLRQEAHELGGVLDKDAIEQSVKLTDTMWRWEFAMRGVKASIVTVLLPAVDWVISKAVGLVKVIQPLLKNTDAIRHAWQLLGIAATGLGIKLLIPFLPALFVLAKLALAIGVLYLVFDDLLTLFEGGDSVIGRLIDSLFGPGSATQAVNYLKDAWEGFILFYSNEVVPVMQAAGAEIHKLFEWIGGTIDTIAERWASHSAKMSEGWTNLKNAVSEFGDLFSETWGSVWRDWVAGFDEISEAAERLIGWLEKIPGVETLAKFLTIPSAQTAGGEQRTYERGIGAQPGPGTPETAGAVRETPVPVVIQTAAGSVPIVPPPAMGAAQAAITPRTELNLNVQVPPGSSAQDVARETENAVRRVLKDERRATLNAVKQRAG